MEISIMGASGFLLSCNCDLAEVMWPARLTRHQSFKRHGHGMKLKPRSQSVAAGSTVHCQRWQSAWTTWNIDHDGLSLPLWIESLYR